MPYIGNPIYQSAFVTDQFSGTGSQTAYTMSVAPAGTTNVLVVVSGVVQDPSTYGVVGNTLTFSTAPPSGTGNISCRYLGVPVTGVFTTAYRTLTTFTATAGQTTFTPPSYTVGYINVYRNGVLLTPTSDYTASNGTTVVLATGATAGDTIIVESFLVSSVLNALPQSGGTLSGNLVVTGTETVAGNLGVGTTNPTYNFDTVGTTRFSSGNNPIDFANSSGTPYWRMYPSFSDGAFYISRASGNPVVGTAADIIKITPQGNLQFTVPNGSNGITFNKSGALNNQILNDYEYGNWTPTDGSGAGLSFTIASAFYVKVGTLVFVNTYFSYPVTSNSNAANISGLPFTAGGGYSYLLGRTQNNISGGPIAWQVNNYSTNATSNTQNNSSGSPANSQLSGSYVLISGCYNTN